MAFSVKQIKALLSEHGLPVDNLDAAADEICRRHAADLDSIKEERDTYKKDAETLAEVQKELDALKNQPDDGYKEKYEKEHKDFSDFKASVEQEKTLEAKKAAFKELCVDAGLSEKGVSKAVKYADWEKVELDENGKVKDPKDHIKTLKEELAEHVVTEKKTGVETPTPLGGTGSKGPSPAVKLYQQHYQALYGVKPGEQKGNGESK